MCRILRPAGMNVPTYALPDASVVSLVSRCPVRLTNTMAPKQYEPVKFGDPFNPHSVDGHRGLLAKRAEGLWWKDNEGQRLVAIEAARPMRIKLWESLRRIIGSTRPKRR